MAWVVGDHVIAFYGGAVAKYQYYVDSIAAAEDVLSRLRTEESGFANRLAETKERVSTTVDKEKIKATATLATIEASLKMIQNQIGTAEREVKRCTDRAKSTDIVDIVVSQPIQVRVIAKDKP